MKNFISLLAIFFASFAFLVAQQSASSSQQSASQMPQLAGRYFIEGSLRLDFTSSSNFPTSTPSPDNPNTSITYYIFPSAGYYLSDRWAIGLETGYSYSNNKNYNYSYTVNSSHIVGNTNTSSNTFTIAPFLQYSLPVSEKVIFNLTFTAPFSTGTNNSTYTSVSSPSLNYEISSTNYSVGAVISPGVQWFVSDKLAVVGSIGSLSYSHSTSEPKPTSTSSSTYKQSSDNLYLSLTSNFSLGVVLYWGGK